MNIILFGASGMVGQGVLRECLLDPGVKRVLSIGRSATGQANPKLVEIVHRDIADLTPIQDRLSGYDACFFCLGASSIGMKEADYRRVTYDYTLGAARTLAELNPEMTFVYVSGAGTDSGSRTMWARVKGETENALLRLPFKAAYMFRPGFIQPLRGIQSKTALYRVLYKILGPLNPLALKFFPQAATTTEILGRAMIKVARNGTSKHVLRAGTLTHYEPATAFWQHRYLSVRPVVTRPDRARHADSGCGLRVRTEPGLFFQRRV